MDNVLKISDKKGLKNALLGNEYKIIANGRDFLHLISVLMGISPL